MPNLIQDQLLSSQSLTTYAGLATAVVFVTNGIIRAFRFNASWLGLLVALLICVVTVSIGEKKVGWDGYFIAVLNAFIVYGTALGENSVMGKVADQIGTPTDGGVQGAGPEAEAPQIPFFTKWI